MTPGRDPGRPGLTIGRRDFEAIRRSPRFARRPYRCLFLVREAYPVHGELLAALTALGLRPVVVPVTAAMDKGTLLERLIQAILEHRPDCVLTLSHTGVDPEGTLVGLLGDLRLPLASWLLDSPDLMLAPYPELAADHVAVFSCDAGAVEPIRRLGYRHVWHLPLAAATVTPPTPPAPAVPSAPVAFVGENYLAETARRLRSGRFGRELLGSYKALAKRQIARRARSLDPLWEEGEEALRERYCALGSARARQDFELAVLCAANTRYRAGVLRAVLPLGPLVVGPPGWKTLLGPAGRWRWHPPVHDPAWIAALFRASPVNLNSTSIHMRGAQNQRVFDVPAAGGFVLTDRDPQLEALFEPGKEVATYAGEDDARGQCERFLGDAPARAAIVAAARRRIASEHTYGHRVAVILRALKSMR